MIPAYQPSQELLDIIEQLARDPEQKIIIVNDGSTGKSLDIFNQIDTHQNQVEILRHAVNLRDSLRIYFVFLRFSMVSLATAVLDYITFAICFQFSQNILLSLIAARIVGGSFQFTIGKVVVFKSKNKVHVEAVNYTLLVLVLMMISYGLITLQVTYLKISPYIAKILAESMVFALSLQRKTSSFMLESPSF